MKTRGGRFLLAFICLWIGSAQAQKPVAIRIHPEKTYQTIHNFGASDAWSCPFVGNWPDAKRNAIADLLFSRDTLPSGSAKGIGLSLWRFTIGAGSAEQGEASGIKDEWRRAPSFLDEKGNFTSKNAGGQLWFLKAAKVRGVPHFLAFCNSPPVQLTRNKKAFADHSVTNLDPQNYRTFADFLAQTIGGIEHETGIKVNYVSPVNEPQWDWSDGGQEGTPFRNSELAALVKEMDAVFTGKNVLAKIILPEAGQIDFLFDANGKPDRGKQVHAFFAPGLAFNVGRFASVEKAIAAHSYFTTSPKEKAIRLRKRLADTVNRYPGLRYWQSEYCILGDNTGEINGSGRDTGIVSALYVAGVIHHDLTVANASAWQWWTAISAYDYKDGLIYVDKNKSDGNFTPAKTLWALGNWSRFVRPGMRRFEAEMAGEKNLLVSAFGSEDHREIVCVVVNPETRAQDVIFPGEKGSGLQPKQMYITGSAESLGKHLLRGKTVRIPPQSIATVILEKR
ncbi:MAG: xylanase [Mucilaginibacter polytrichastri]|nr:xylanase [Mucilaginibacter polytrichastri]